MAGSTFGQADSTINKEVEVFKAYQPSISDAYKISTNPIINDTIVYAPVFEYHIFSKDVPIEKNINHLPVVTLGNPPKTKSKTGYAKAGFGNALSPYGEVVVNTAPTKNTDFGLQLFHFSSNPKVKLNNDLKIKAPNSNSLARIFVKNYFRKSVMVWDINYQRTGYSYYGFPLTDTTIFNQIPASHGDLGQRQALNTASSGFKLKNMDTRTKLDYTVGLGYDYFWNNTGQTSHHAEYNGLYTQRNRNYQVLLDSKFEYFYEDSVLDYSNDTLSIHQYFHVAIAPQISLNKDIYELKAGFNLSTMINADSTMLWHISPKIYFAYHPIKGILTLFAGTDGGFAPNSYQQTVYANQYINNFTSTKPSNKVFEIYGGLKGKLSRKLAYMFDVNYAINKNEALHYLSQTNTNEIVLLDNRFRTSYDDISTLKFGGNLRFSGTRLMLELKGNYYLYNAKSMSTVLSYRPDFDASFSSSFQVTDRIKATINGEIVGPRLALIESHNIVTSSTSHILTITNEISTLPTILNLNLGAEYAYTKNIGFFIDAQNILNQNYQIWQGYNHQGMLIMLGGRYTF